MLELRALSPTRRRLKSWNKQAINNSNALERLRRNLMVGSIVVALIGLTGIPDSLQLAGIKFNKAPNYLYYTMAVGIMLYLCWSYYALIESAEIRGFGPLFAY